MSDIHKMSLSSLLCQIDSIKDNSASFLPGEGKKQDPDKKIWQDDVDAVSYTHLDVYKRQEKRLPFRCKKDSRKIDGARLCC